MAIGEKQVLGPVERAAPLRLRPTPICWLLIAGAVAMFFLDERLARDYLIDGERGRLPLGALYGPLVARGEWWRLFLTVLEHGGVLHLALNMSVVLSLGRALERAIHSWRFALLSAICALGSATFALLFSYDAPTVGASGMILGWAGALLPIANRAGRESLITWLIQVAIISLFPQVSWQGHLGGFLFGLPCGFGLRRAERFKLWAPIFLFLSAVAALAVGSGKL